MLFPVLTVLFLLLFWQLQTFLVQAFLLPRHKVGKQKHQFQPESLTEQFRRVPEATQNNYSVQQMRASPLNESLLLLLLIHNNAIHAFHQFLLDNITYPQFLVLLASSPLLPQSHLVQDNSSKVTPPYQLLRMFSSSRLRHERIFA
ncbi:hypothetical protein SDC9_153693 [bioreactor metagenome]|uniref:Uncharacterized protein n=1 Tax=bioreactor metagenome TaxID=1076179 RepID=A0A645EX23_9ZZZZ